MVPLSDEGVCEDDMLQAMIEPIGEENTLHPKKSVRTEQRRTTGRVSISTPSISQGLVSKLIRLNIASLFSNRVVEVVSRHGKTA